MYPTLAFGLFMVLAAVRFAARPEATMLPVVRSLAYLTGASGVLGFTTGLINSLLYIEKVPPEKRYIWMIGLGESLCNVGLALVLVVLMLLFVAAGHFRLAARVRTE
jgi:hypothetical protein